MLRKNIVCLFVLIAGICNAQQIKEKMMYLQSPSVGRLPLHILPWGYDSTVTEEQIAACLDTLPGHLLAAKMYNLLYKDDSTRLAVKANEGIYFFHKRFTIRLYWKNGNRKILAYAGRHHNKYRQYNYHENDAPESCGKYKKGHKVGKWKYFNSDCKKIKVEKYAKDGTIKKTKTFDPPKKTLKAIFNPRHPKGTPYIIN